MPNRVLVHLDPDSPPRGLARANASVRSLVDEVERDPGTVKDNVRICEDFTCGSPIEDVEGLCQRIPHLVQGGRLAVSPSHALKSCAPVN